MGMAPEGGRGDVRRLRYFMPMNLGVFVFFSFFSFFSELFEPIVSRLVVVRARPDWDGTHNHEIYEVLYASL